MARAAAMQGASNGGVRIDAVDLVGAALGAVGGAMMATTLLGGTSGLWMAALMLLTMPFTGAAFLLPILRRRPWALMVSSTPFALSLFLTFGLVSLAGAGPAARRPAYIWGSLAAALAFAVFSVYAHRDGMRRHA